MSDVKLQKYMEELSKYFKKTDTTPEEQVIIATAMLYTTRMIYEENYGAEMAINLIDTIGGSKVQWVKPTVH